MKKLGRALVANVASSTDPGRPGRVALIEMRKGKVAEVKWISLWDLCSVPGIDQGRKSCLEKTGIRTPCDLAEAPAEKIARAIQTDDSETARLQAHASAFCRQDVILLRKFSIPTKNRGYLTIENCSASDHIQLMGFHLESEDRTIVLFAETAEDEEEILMKMLRLLSSSSRLNLICFSGGLWQQQLLSRRLASHGLPTRITQSIRDIYFDIERCLAFPTRRLGLREVAECCGFKWRSSSTAESSSSTICGVSQRFTKKEKETLVRRTEEELLALRHIVLYLDRRMARG